MTGEWDVDVQITRCCDWCGELLHGRDQSTKTCSDRCRITLSRWRRGEGPFSSRGRGHDHRGRARPFNETVAREHAERDRKRARRRNGPIPSDRRIQFSRAVDACVAAMRQVGSISEQNARVIAERELLARAPRAVRGG